jgi:hypothetical protein
MSAAMVDLRAGLDQLARRGAIRARDAFALAARAKARPFRERSWADLPDDARALRLPRRACDAIATLAARAPSQKAADARALLRRLARTRPHARPGHRLPQTWFWHQLVAIVEGDS